MRNFLQISKAWDYIIHRRMIAFWTVMVVMLPLPWMVPACTTAPKSQAHHDNCKVLSVYDGDTMTVNCQGEKIKVRLYCIDAPEMGQEPWGREVRDYLRSITGPSVQLEVKDKDRYGRMVGEVFTDDEDRENLNLTMVWSSNAVVYPKYCNDRQYYQSEEEAKKLHSGIWEKPGLHQKPWEWRSSRH